MYVPSDGPKDRFVPPPGVMPPLHLIEYSDGLRLCEDSTGLLVGPTNRHLAAANIYVTNLRGMAHYAKAARAADLRPGQPLRLVPEPDNPHDRFAIAVHSADGIGPVGYVNKQKARAWSKLLAAGAGWGTISLGGTEPGKPCGGMAILSANPAVVRHVLSPRPAGLPTPVFLLGEEH
ncbi:HIRAN domain-containing protein [Streptomyces sp. DvalAA-14]|uniref:HIRAN domain-containing protein n=1 Tax=unclassified Streptomyces TaxID=2593676 RepID=UPI00081B54E2|nr:MULTISPECIES: HIRAN domain-containing protein [unclassified Streptomyces]MYS22238.1 hypothetical protein [Streptomyces sp. SID4948]SCE11838.1 HIRAN domain-containing protein [Streptomyces sp. DvalAA-14]